MNPGAKIARWIWWRIVKAMRAPRGRLLRNLQNLTPQEREARMKLFRKNEKFARRYGPKMLSLALNGFFLVLTVVFLVNLAQIAIILNWIPDLQQLSNRFNQS